MGCTIDHLGADRQVVVIRDFVDARGTEHRYGETGFIQNVSVDWHAQEFTIEWSVHDGWREILTFAIQSTTGPGIGRMRDYFEVINDSYPATSQQPPEPAPGFPSPASLPHLSKDMIHGRDRYEAAIERVWALARRGRFNDAETQLRAITDMPPDAIAASLGSLAMHHVRDPDPAVYNWMKDRSINYWYSWGSQATSGGDGTARLLEIQPAVDRFKMCDAWRKAQFGE